ncbi:hypothetical protein SCUP515_07389 [Seiridium cupressi]
MPGLKKLVGKDDALPAQGPFASTPQPLAASCHCGRVTLEIPSKPQDICECHCTICYRYGALWAYYKRGQVTITVSAEPVPGVSQQSYVRTDEGAEGDIGFFWCGHCGCMTHWWKMGQDGPSDDAEAKMGVNSRMLPKHLVEDARRSIVTPTPVAMDLYIYDSLPGENYIRTATILPGKAEDDIIIDLATIPFLESGLAEYTALSYAWGSPEIHIYVKIRGINDNSLGLGHRHLGQIGVSKSLATALCDLRRGASPRTMWIDALRINQSNHEEKANQVTKMGDIFGRAAQVVAYIGPETDESTKLMDYMEHLGNTAEFDWSTGSLNVVDLRHKWNGMRLLDDNQNLLIDADLQTGLYQLLCLPWFGRLWIWQEIYLSALKAIVTCGFRGVRWRLFYRAWTCLYNHFARTDSLNPHYLRKLWHNSSLLEQDRFTSLCALRHSFRGAKCTDPRDRLFAVLELLPENEKVLITVDYKKLPQEIYKEATLKWMEANRDLSILRECELRDGWAAPTWVPNWGADSQVDGGAGMRLGTSWLAAILDSSQTRKNGVMRVVGINITVIEDLRPSGISITSTNIVAKLHDLFGSIQMEGDYVVGGTLREAYAASLMDGKFPTAIEPICDDFSPIEDVIEIVQLACSASPRNVLPLKETMATWEWRLQQHA